MSKELVVSSNRHETKVAIVEDDQLVEIYFQRSNEYSLAGSIHKGRVTRVLPGMQSAFVDLGLERDTFLYVSDFFEENGDEYDKIPDERPSRGRERDRDRDKERERPEAPRVTASAPAIQTTKAEPSEQTIEAAVEPAPERAEKPADLSTDARDPRGRRGRRRRNRGRGFPESKYASDLSAETQEAESVEPVLEDEPAAEVFLLPGESLAKYRPGRGTATSSPIEEEIADDVDVDSDVSLEAEEEEPAAESDSAAIFSEIEEERLEAGQVSLSDDDLQTEPLPADIEDDTPATKEFEQVAEAEEDDEPGIHTVEDVGDDRLTGFIEDAVDSAGLPETAQPDADAIDAEDPITDEDEPEAVEALAGEQEEISALKEATAEDAPYEQPVTASVRDQSNRYQHRTSRRMRRRRGSSSSEQRTAEPPPAEVVEVRTPPRERERDREREREKPVLPSISDLLREGQEIIVQIAKEPLGQKGARITSHIALPGRYVVFMPTLEHLGVSRKISTDEERLRLKRILQTHREGTTGGFIVRTAGEGRSEDEIAGDMAYLYNLWLDIRQKAEKKPAPVLLHHDLDIVQRILRDQLSDMFKSIWCDNEEVYESVLRFMQRFQPALVGRVKLYTRTIPIFDAFNITQEIEKALRPKVWLKSGGYIVVNQTEALVAIDVNTGKYVGKSNRLEDTITKTNTEAAKEIVRQVRLRDLGGIIVVDFIDMDERKNRQKVMQALEEAMRADRAPYKILQFNDFGLVAITRKRVKQSLERSLCTPCPACEGAGYVKSVATVIGEILQEAGKIRRSVEGKNVELRAHPDVAKVLKSSKNTHLEEIEEILGRPVMVISDGLLHPEKFDLAW
jgi:ribonuclease G